MQIVFNSLNKAILLQSVEILQYKYYDIEMDISITVSILTSFNWTGSDRAVPYKQKLRNYLFTKAYVQSA